MSANIEQIMGMCPVQAWGTVAGRNFFFRACGDNYSFAVSKDTGLAEEIENPLQGYYVSLSYGKWPQAGYMPESEARRIIEAEAVKYLEVQNRTHN